MKPYLAEVGAACKFNKFKFPKINVIGGLVGGIALRKLQNLFELLTSITSATFHVLGTMAIP